jgi:ATP-dependent Zn protease
MTHLHESASLHTLREHYLDDIAMILAGRAAEDVCCGTISDSCSEDLKMVSAECTTFTRAAACDKRTVAVPIACD